MFANARIHRTWLVLCAVLLLAFGLGACTVKLVADYDEATFNEVLRVGKEVDRFYGMLLEVPEGQRPYATYAKQYVDIETDIRSLVTRNQARPLNKESTQISETILKLWIKYKDKHEAKNAYPTAVAKLDRHRFQRLFRAAAAAEEAKKLKPGDTDVSQ